jgi:hypothetical protein
MTLATFHIMHTSPQATNYPEGTSRLGPRFPAIAPRQCVSDR